MGLFVCWALMNFYEKYTMQTSLFDRIRRHEKIEFERIRRPSDE
jgi:hypothetical protein